MNNYLIVLLGPTASGKTETGIRLAKKLNCEILSADSRQFYKEMHIGTAKPSIKEMQGVKHHFIDFLSIEDDYSAGRFEEDAISLLNRIYKKQHVALLLGGSGLYLDAVCKGIDKLPGADAAIRRDLSSMLKNEGITALKNTLRELDPVYYEEIDINNPRRIMRALEVCLISGKPYSAFLSAKKKQRDFSIIKIGLKPERETLYSNINTRVDEMIKKGLVAEARKLHKHKHLNALQTVGYTELFSHFEGKTTLEEAIELIKRNTRRYARRQLTWFRKDKAINWFLPDEQDKMLQFAETQL